MEIQTLSKRESQNLIEKITARWGISLEKIKNIRMIKIDKIKVIELGNHTTLEIDNLIIPALTNEELLKKFTSVTVDTGAVKPICNGANLMRPGIKSFEGEFKKGDIVGIKEERYNKHIAIGLALIDKEKAEKLDKGTILENLHYVGDKAWEILKELKLKGIIK
ncbi:MAG: PUA domain-containing protein [Nitrososphaerales archaeon]